MKTTTSNILAVLLALGALLAAPTTAEDPYTEPDDTWISISGTVDEVNPDTFLLDYGDGLITVEMDDGDRDADAYKLLEGDEVTVNGMIDDDFFETTTIEASSVYVDKLNTYFYASVVDEEDAFVTITTPIVPGALTIQGTVTEIAGEEEFVVDTGLRRVLVETDALGYDPLDDEGYQRIEVGDEVSVTGEIDVDFLEGRELVASSVIELRD
ncbi:MAG: hypothetical protein R3234_02815 [Thermoanaerobaculia bacterium]|nr:hypothetical protein [Thermoanaerobaculia bacterium]